MLGEKVQPVQSGAAKGLIVVAVIAVLISLVGIMINLSFLSNVKTFAGKASQESGNATLIVQQVANINFTNNTLNWGAGTVDTSGPGFATLHTNYTSSGAGTFPSSGGASGGVSWTNLSRGLVLVNIGNSNVSLTLQSDKGAFEFIGYSGFGLTPTYQWWLNNDTADDGALLNAGESGSCQGGGAALSPNPFTAFVDVSNNTAATVCNNFSHLPLRNELEIDIFLRIPVATPTGGKNSTLTAVASALP